MPAFIRRWERRTSLFHRGRIHFIAQFHHRKKTRKEETPPAPGGDSEAVITGTRHRNENIDRTSEVQAFTSENPGAVRVINHRLSPLDLPSLPAVPLPPTRGPSLFLVPSVPADTKERLAPADPPVNDAVLVDRARHSSSRPSAGELYRETRDPRVPGEDFAFPGETVGSEFIPRLHL